MAADQRDFQTHFFHLGIGLTRDPLHGNEADLLAMLRQRHRCVHIGPGADHHSIDCGVLHDLPPVGIDLGDTNVAGGCFRGSPAAVAYAGDDHVFKGLETGDVLGAGVAARSDDADTYGFGSHCFLL